MKKKSVIAAVGMMSLWLAACGQAGGTGNVQTEPSVWKPCRRRRAVRRRLSSKKRRPRRRGSCGANCSGTDRSAGADRGFGGNGSGFGGVLYGDAGFQRI